MVQLIESIVTGSFLLGVVILCIVLWKTLQQKKTGEPSIDERVERIAGKAARYSMIVTSLSTIVICGYYWAIMMLFSLPFDPFIAISLIAVLLVMAFSSIVFRWYLDKKGDFE